jgi:flagellar basal body-associated protein FliL
MKMASDKAPINSEGETEVRPRSKRKSYVIVGVLMAIVLIIIAAAVIYMTVFKNKRKGTIKLRRFNNDQKLILCILYNQDVKN